MPELESLGSIPRAMLAVALLISASTGLGGVVVRPVLTSRWRWRDAFLLRFTTGLHLLGALGVILGQFGMLTNGRSVWLLGGLSVWCIASNWRSIESGIRQIPRRARRWPPLVAWPAMACAAVTLGPALSFPTGWDELVYHGVLPQRWLAEGWPKVYQDLPYSGFPSCGEILFWLMAPIEYLIAPRLLVWICWLLALVGIDRWLRQWVGAATSTLLTLAFALNDAGLLISANCYVESILMLDVAVLLLVVSLPGWRRSDGLPWDRAAVFGVLAGGAAAVKLTGGAVLAVPCIWYARRLAVRRARFRDTIVSSTLYGVIALSVCLPFYARPWLATKNPCYPYFEWWCTDDAAQLEMSHYHHDIGSFSFGVKSLSALVDAPLLLAFRPENYDGEFGWQLLIFLALAIVAVVSVHRRRWRPIVCWPLAVALWFYLFWLMTAQQARFAVSCVLAILLLAGLGMRILSRGWRQFARLALVVCVLCSVPWVRCDYYLASWLTVVGGLSRTDYVHNLTDHVYLPLIQAIHALTPPDARLLLLYEHRGLYLSRQHVIGTPQFQAGPFTPPEKFVDATAILEVLKQHGITHVVAAKTNPGPDQAPGWVERQQPFIHALENCVQQRRLVPRWESDLYLLLEVAK